MSGASDIISSARTSLVALTGSMQESVRTLQSISSSITFETGGKYQHFFVAPSLLSKGRQFSKGQFPAAVEVVAAPKPTSESVSALSRGDVSMPDASDLSVTGIRAPTLDNLSIPTAPQITTVTIPDAPEFVYPVLPTLVDISAPIAPEVLLPSLDVDALAPRQALAEFTYTPEYAEKEWAQAITDAQFAGWIQSLWNGDNIDEGNRLFEAGRDRLVSEAVRGRIDVLNGLAARGINAAGGIVAAALLQVANDTQGRIADLNRDITLKRADLLVQQQSDATGKAAQFIGTLKAYAQAAQERMLNAQKLYLDAEVSKCDFNIKKYNAQLEYLRTRVQAYESELRAALSQIDVYKAQLEAEKLKSEVNAQLVQQYSEQMRGEQVKAATYSALVDACKSRVDVQRAQLEAYRTEVDAQIAKLRVNDSRVQLYSAQLSGERLKIDAFSTRLQAAEAQASWAEKVSRSQLEKFNAELERTKVEQAGFIAEGSTAVQKHNALVSGASALSEATFGEVKAAVDVDRVNIELASAAANAASMADKLNQSESQGAREATLGHVNAQISAASATARAFGTAIAGTASSIAGVAIDQSVTTL